MWNLAASCVSILVLVSVMMQQKSKPKTKANIVLVLVMVIVIMEKKDKQKGHSGPDGHYRYCAARWYCFPDLNGVHCCVGCFFLARTKMLIAQSF